MEYENNFISPQTNIKKRERSSPLSNLISFLKKIIISLTIFWNNNHRDDAPRILCDIIPQVYGNEEC